MTVYDFFIKRALDQFFYNLYWKSGFICIGTPSGVTLSPEGAQHSWKSDIQIPNLVTWEPMYAKELDWIVADTVRRHFTGDNKGRQGVLIRCVTRAIKQSEFLVRLRRHKRFKAGLGDRKLTLEENPRPGAVREDLVETLPDAEIFEQVRQDVLRGGYRLVDYRGYDDYEPGDNVVQIFCQGAVGTEALKASDRLYKEGIYANVIVVTSQDLLLGNLAHEEGYDHLRKGLHINGDLHVSKFEVGGSVHRVANRRIPIVSVNDGEPGIMDNIGSIVGVKQVALAVRKFSKCGRPPEVYDYQHIDHQAVYDAAKRCLQFAADEGVRVRG
jgi:pyruvate dehydrogenase E1 component